MPAQPVFYKPLSKLDPDLDGDVGSLAINASLLASRDLPMLAGFVLTSELFQYLYTKHLHSLILSATSHLNLLSPASLNQAYQKIKTRLYQRPPTHLFSSLSHQYQRLLGNHPCFMVFDPVGGSSKHHYLPLNPVVAKGDSNFIAAVIDTLLSPFTPGSLFYLARHHLDVFSFKPSILVYKLPRVTASGFILTQSPYPNPKFTHRIESVWGLPGPLYSGELNPTVFDYHFSQKTILHADKPNQPWQQQLSLGSLERHPLLPKQLSALPLTPSDVAKLSLFASKVHQALFTPQRILWFKTDHGLKLAYTQPHDAALQTSASPDLSSLKLLSTGTVLSPGLCSGEALVLDKSTSIKDIKGKVLILDTLHPDYLPLLAQARGVVAAFGSQVSHTAILARELSIPVIANVSSATELFHTGQSLTLNANSGEIFAGRLNLKTKPKSPLPQTSHSTATKLFLLSQNHLNPLTYHTHPSDGLFLHRPLALPLKPPSSLLARIKRTGFSSLYIPFLHRLALNFGSRPVIYDLGIHPLPSATPPASPQTQNPNPFSHTPLKTVLESLALARSNQHTRNLHLSLPSVRTPLELLNFKKLLAKHGLKRSPSLQFWLPLSFPANLHDVDKLIDIGVDGLFFHLDSLVYYQFGLDPQNLETLPSYHHHPALLTAAQKLARKAHRHHLPLMAFSTSNLPDDLVYSLVKLGFSHLCLPLAPLPQIRQTLIKAETAHLK